MDEGEIGRRIGHDLFRFGRGLRPERMPPSVAEGIADARGRLVASREADRFVSKWLQLRLNAFSRKRSFDERVTPAFLREIDVAACPVTREPLTHALRLPSDWSVDRLNNDGAYAPNNLAVISTRANKAKGARTFDEVLALAGGEATTDGLAPVAWGRLASLMLGPCFAGNARAAPLIPLTAPVCAHGARPAIQLIQYVFTRRGGSLAGKNALMRRFGPIGRQGFSSVRLDVFAQSMLFALKRSTPVWDVWLRPDVMTAFVAWRHSMDARSWALVGEAARQMAGAMPVGRDVIDAWRLTDRGYAN